MDATPERLLVVDDEANMVALLRRILEKEGYQVEGAASGEEALTRVETTWFDLVITDLRMAHLNGLELLRRAKAVRPSLPFILLTAFGSVESAVAAMKEGAVDYLTKPVENNQLKHVVKRTLEFHRLSRALERVREQNQDEQGFPNIIGQSKLMQALFRQTKLVANSNSTILLQGESGTGKELIARAIHQHSTRSAQPLVAVDCGTIAEPLLESELFGHVKGAFTGATTTRKGLFEEAQAGTLFLDEIGDIPLSFQAKLLRVLQEGEIRPVGRSTSIRVDVRVITATSKDLAHLVQAGTFREELYYRLAVVPLIIPPLRQRREDIPLLVEHFIHKYCAQNQLAPKRVLASTLSRLVAAPWPGNVRELEHVIERAVLLSPGAELALQPPFPLSASEAPRGEPLGQATKEAQETLERERIREALLQAQGVRSHTARLLGISRATLYTKLKRYHLEDVGAPQADLSSLLDRRNS